MKKVVARKMGLTTKELNKKYFKKNKEVSKRIRRKSNMFSGMGMFGAFGFDPEEETKKK